MEKNNIFFGQKMHFFDKKMHFFDKEAFFSNKKYFVCRLTRLPFYKILFSLIWKKKNYQIYKREKRSNQNISTRFGDIISSIEKIHILY